MTIKQELQKALTAAMKARDEDTKRVLRLVMTSIKLAEVEDKSELDDARILSILQKELKTREDSIKEAEMAKRTDLVEAAQREMIVLNRFLPAQMNISDLTYLAEEVIKETGASGLRDMGIVMKILMPRLEGRASGQEASKVVRELLQNH